MISIRISDYIVKTLADRDIDTVFLVTGGFAMHLNDALAGESRLRKICHHHEQAAAYAAEGYGHITGRPALLMVTAGPGAINAMSGVFGAYVDSIPMIVISGQSKRELVRSTYQFEEMRQLGEQEADIISMVRPITKYARQVMQPERIVFELEKAMHIAVSGRPGPVWLEIPLDVQAASIDPVLLPHFTPPTVPVPDLALFTVGFFERLKSSERPLLVVGPDIPHAAAPLLRQFAEKLGCPIVGAGAEDTILNDHPLYAGRMGIVGTRAGNIAVQNADTILFLGMRPYLGLVTYDWKNIGSQAHKVVVDEDPYEFEKPCCIADERLLCDLPSLLQALNCTAADTSVKPYTPWLDWCHERLKELPVVSDSMRTYSPEGRINPYWFVEELTSQLSKKDIIVASNASSSVISLQAGRFQGEQRLFSNHGNGAMGFALPAAIGACVAAQGRRVICFEGDGSIMMNIQELQTIAHHQLPIIVIIFNNDGYLSIKQTQKNYFGRELGAGASSGLSLPDFLQLGAAFGIKTLRICGEHFKEALKEALSHPGPLLVDAHLDPDQGFEPKVASRRLADGSMVSSPPEDMFPFLAREELERHLWRGGKS